MISTTSPPSVWGGGGGNLPDWTGAELLCLLLTGYANDPETPGQPFESGSDMSEDDGNNGFGFRNEQRGKVYGPYNGAENVTVASGPNSNSRVFIDNFDNPILYYRYRNDSGTMRYVTDDNAGVSPASSGDPDQDDYLDPAATKQATGTFLLLTIGPDYQWGVQGHFPDGSTYPWEDFDDMGNFEKN